MNATRELLERVGERFAFPEHAFEGFQRRRDRKHRNQRIRAGVVGIAIFMAAVLIVMTGGPAERSFTPADDSPTVAPDVADPVGLIGLPPVGATPSTPRRGALVLSFFFGHTFSDGGRFQVEMYADGRLISWRFVDNVDIEQRGRVEQRLTPEGVELVRSEVISTGLFDHDLPHLASEYGLYFGQIDVRNGDRLVRVTWGDCCGHAESAKARQRPTPEQASALQRLDERLADPTSWLPASAWEDPEIKPYVASRYSVCYEEGAPQQLGASRLLTLLPRAAEDLLRAKDRTQEEYTSLAGSFVYWCSDVTTQEARALAQILEGADIRQNVFGDNLSYEISGTDVGLSMFPHLGLSMAPLLPNDIHGPPMMPPP